LVENRRHLVDERTRLVNQLHSTLKTYFPLALELLEDQMNTLLAAEFLMRWPSLEAVQKEKPKALRAFFYKHNSRNAKRIEQRIQAVPTAQPLTTDRAIIEPACALVSARAGMLRPLHKALQGLDKAIAKAMEEHPDAAIFRSFPGAGPALAPRLLVAFGTNRKRFGSAAEVAQFYGIAPVVQQSGNCKTVHVRYRCPKFGRQTFHENAACAFKKEPWARAYYQAHKNKHDDKHHPACRALAFKLTRIYFACWRDKKTYQPDRYLQALQKNGSPLHKALKPQSLPSCE
jgi:transposase